MRILAIVLFFTVSISGAALAQRSIKASFDCSKANAADERVICSDAELGQADQDLAKNFLALRDRLAASDRQPLISGARSWVKARRARCKLDAKVDLSPSTTPAFAQCLKSEYRERAALMSAWLAMNPQPLVIYSKPPSFESFAGKWTIVAATPAAISAMEDAEARKWVGRTQIIGPTRLAMDVPNLSEAERVCKISKAEILIRTPAQAMEDTKDSPFDVGMFTSQGQVVVVSTGCNGTAFEEIMRIGDALLISWDGMYFYMLKKH